ncbi:MAG: ACP phosphodiesterase [Imperialibacter sp.]|uniref:acyl carrier protein phosphodiesterase n=1 Tax=Imperialibacter sp. TaxID=2038411 RepID=UPI0032EC942C
MNFLAHIYLSGPERDIQLGNFIGDFVKGNQLTEFPDRIQAGIMLHRHIDTYTDTHEVVRESKLKLREGFGHYAPVIVDVFYDHFLARDWQKHHPQDLKAFTESFYALAKSRGTDLPPRASKMLSYMSADNWLYNYQFIEGIKWTLTGMSRRTSFNSNMELAHKSLEAHYASFEKEFNIFFPDLIHSSNQFLEELKNRFSL